METQRLFFLHSIPHKEYQKVIRFYGPDGAKTFISKNSKKELRKISSTLRPCESYEVSFRENSQKDIQFLTSFELRSPPQAFHPQLMAQRSFLAEVFYRILRESGDPAELYQVLVEWEDQITLRGYSPDDHVFILIQMIRKLGYGPVFDQGLYPYKYGLSPDSEPDFDQESLQKALNLHLSLSFGAVFATSFPKYNRGHAIQILLNYLLKHHPYSAEIRSAAVLYDIFR